MTLFTRRSTDGGVAASILLGGTRISAGTEEELKAELDRASSLILRALSEDDWTVRSYLKYTVSKDIDADNPERVFSGVFGHLLGKGEVCSLNCLSKNNVYYQIFYGGDKEFRVAESLRVIVARLMVSKQVSVADIRDDLFPGKPKASWPKTALLVDALNFVGHAGWLGKFDIQRSEGLEYAIGAAAGTRINTGKQWLVV